MDLKELLLPTKKNREPVVLRESDALVREIEYAESLLEQVPNEMRQGLKRQILELKAGNSGEKSVLYELKASHMPIVILQDLYMEKDDLSIQIDFYVVARKKNYIIECKKLYGDITVQEDGSFIREYTWGKRKYREGFDSPVNQNRRHLEMLKSLKQTWLGRHWFDDMNQSVIVLANSNTVLNAKRAPKHIRKQIVRKDQLVDYIRKNEAACKEMESGDGEMLDRGNNILELCSEHDWHKRYEKYEDAVKKDKQNPDEADLTEQKTQESPAEICPWCGSPLVLRKSQYGEFWGCSRFPKCRFKRNKRKRD
jgi:hypothetical protein